MPRRPLPPNLATVSPPPRFNVLGVGVHALSLDEARDLIVGCRATKTRGYVCCATAYNANLARSDAELRHAYNRSLLTAPDGMPLVWLGRWHGHSGVTRVYGPDLMLAVCDAGRATGLKHFFYGGDVGTVERLSAALRQRFPSVQIVGSFTPPFRELTPAEFSDLQSRVADVQPDVLWVGLSTPKQEKFMARYGSALAAPVLIGVGAAFDFHSGRVSQAPRWMQRSGLEWFYRLCVEPRRLWKRYLVNNPLFVVRTLAQLTGLRRYPLEDSHER